MQCPTCQTELPSDAQFCGACGAVLRADQGANHGTGPLSAPPRTTPKPSAFQLEPADFVRALEDAAKTAGLSVESEGVDGHRAYFERGQAAGMAPAALERALHRVSLAKLPGAPAAVGLDDTHGVRRGRWLGAVLGINIAALIAGGLAWKWSRPVAESRVELVTHEGRIDKAALSETTATLAEAARGCLERALQREGGADTGDIVLQLTIGLKGELLASAVQKDTLARPDVQACVLKAAQAAAFPAAQGAPVEVRIPLVFHEAGDDVK